MMLWLCMNQSFSKGKVYNWWIIPLLIWQWSRIIWTDICEWCRHFRSKNSQMMTTFDWVMGFFYLRLIWFKYPKCALPPGTTHPILRHRFCNKTKSRQERMTRGDWQTDKKREQDDRWSINSDRENQRRSSYNDTTRFIVYCYYLTNSHIYTQWESH